MSGEEQAELLLARGDLEGLATLKADLEAERLTDLRRRQAAGGALTDEELAELEGLEMAERFRQREREEQERWEGLFGHASARGGRRGRGSVPTCVPTCHASRRLPRTRRLHAYDVSGHRDRPLRQ